MRPPIVANNTWLGQSFVGEAALVWQVVLKLERAFVPVRAALVAITAAVWLTHAPVPGAHPGWAAAVFVAACLYVGLGFALLRSSLDLAARFWPAFPLLDLLFISACIATTGLGHSPFLILIFLGAITAPGVMTTGPGLVAAGVYGLLWALVALPDQKFIAAYVVLFALLYLTWGRVIRRDRSNQVRDPLTGCFGRGHAMQELDRLVAHGIAFAVVLFDLDGFKQVNDQHGHAAGDAVLQAAAHHMARAAGAQDLLARLGGDEFLLVLPETNAVQAGEAAERIRDALEQAPLKLPGGGAAHVTLSAGVAETDGRASVTALLTEADRRLYQAKAHRNAAPAGAWRPTPTTPRG